MAWLATPRTINAAGVRRRDRPGGRIHSAHSVALARGRWAVEPLPKGSAAGIRLAVRFSPHGTSKPRQPPTAACLACGPPRLQSPPVPTSFTILSHISNLCTIIPSCLACPLPAGSLCGSLARPERRSPGAGLQKQNPAGRSSALGSVGRALEPW